MPKKLGIGGFNAYMKKPSPQPRVQGLPQMPQRGQLAAKRFVEQRMAAPRAAVARQVQQRAGAARSVQQGRVVAAQRKAAARGRGR